MVFPSVYDMTNESMTTARKQHFWEYFSGDSVNRWRTIYNNQGANIIAINDAVDGGAIITTATGSGDNGSINFNNIHQFSHNSSVCISVWRQPTNTSVVSFVGLTSNLNKWDTSSERSIVVAKSANTNYQLRTASGLAVSEGTDGSVAIDTSFHTFKMVLGASNNTVSIDGVADITKTTDLPDIALEPYIGMETLTTASRTTEIMYYEAYNT